MIETWESIREMAEGVGKQQWPQPPNIKGGKADTGGGKGKVLISSLPGYTEENGGLKGVVTKGKVWDNGFG